MATLKVLFTKQPIPLGLAYSAGQEYELPTKLAKACMEHGFAVLVEEPADTTTTETKPTRKKSTTA